MFDNHLMKEAIKFAKLAEQAEEIPVGAIIIDPKDNKIIAQAHNLVENQKNPLAHAEILVIQAACREMQSKNLSGLDIYVTLQPCPMCMHAIALAKIKRVYFGAYDSEISLNLYPSNHSLEIYGGISEEECKELLNKFFINRRNNTNSHD